MVGRKRTQSKTKTKAKPVRKGGKVSKKNLKKVSGGVYSKDKWHESGPGHYQDDA